MGGSRGGPMKLRWEGPGGWRGRGAVPPYEFMWVLVMVAKHNANISVYRFFFFFYFG